MGLSFGASTGGANSSTTSNSSQSNAYSGLQSAVQAETGATLSNDLATSNAGTLTPGVQAQETAADDQVNQTSSGLTSRITQFLAQRGFGKSGQTGQATLQGELGRESQIGSNAATFAGQQGSLNSTNLLAALNYAFTALGSSATGATSGDSTSWGTAVGAGAKVPGFG